MAANNQLQNTIQVSRRPKQIPPPNREAVNQNPPETLTPKPKLHGSLSAHDASDPRTEPMMYLVVPVSSSS